MDPAMSDERLVEDTLFLACTRPAMVLGVTMEAFGLNVMFSSILFILGSSLLYGLVAVPIHLACRLVCRNDPNQFRLLSPGSTRAVGTAMGASGAGHPALL